MNINEVHWNFSDNGTKELAKSRFWNFYNFWTAWNFLMRFSLLCSGEWAQSFYICVFIYIGVSLSLSKAKKNSMGVQEKEQLWFFDIDCKKLDASLLLASRAKKDPRHLFVAKIYGRVNTIKVMSNQSVNLLGSHRRSNKRIFLNTWFQYRFIYN